MVIRLASSLLLRNPMILHRRQKARHYTLKHLNPIHVFTFYFSKIYFNIILSFKLMSPRLVFHSSFSDQNFVSISHFHHEYHNLTLMLIILTVGTKLEACLVNMWLCY
jgi:hypothetical protein